MGLEISLNDGCLCHLKEKSDINSALPGIEKAKHTHFVK